MANCCFICFDGLICLHRRARDYGQNLGINEVWVVHFTIQKESDDFRYPFPARALGVKAMHVWHNLEFSEMRIKTTEFEETFKLP